MNVTAIDLRVREVRLFEEKTGTTYAKALASLGAKLCQQHRLTVKACRECVARRTLCPDHMDAFQECSVCAAAEIPTDVAAVLVWIYRRRRDEFATFDDVEDLTYTEMMTELGEALAGTGSTMNEKPGSPHSSTGSPGSAA
jgi:hypothetical protein